MATRICTKCNVEQPLEAFYKDAGAFGGRSRRCKTCTLKHVAEWQKNNPVKVAARKKRYQDRHPERIKTQEQNYYAKNKKRINAYARQWQKENPAAVAEAYSRWRVSHKPYLRRKDSEKRARKMNATPSWLTAIHRAQIQEMYDIAEARTVQTGVQHHVDHVHPLKGRNFAGLHVPWNLQVLTAAENIAKKNRVPVNERHLFWDDV